MDASNTNNMITSELVVDLKNYLGPGVDVDATGLKRWLSDSYMYMIDEITKVNPDYFAKLSTADTVALQQEYDLPTDFERAIMVNILVDGSWKKVTPLPDASVSQIGTSLSIQSDAASWADPHYYILKDNIGFMPIPSVSGDEAIKLWYVYTPSELSNDSDEPEIPRKYHHLLKIGAKANYLSRDGEDMKGINMWNYFQERVEKMIESMFENQSGEPKSIEITSDHDLFVSNNQSDNF